MINITISDEPKQSVVVPAKEKNASQVVRTVKNTAKPVKASPVLASKNSNRVKRSRFFKAVGRFANKYAPVAKQALVPGGIFLKG